MIIRGEERKSKNVFKNNNVENRRFKLREKEWQRRLRCEERNLNKERSSADIHKW